MDNLHCPNCEKPAATGNLIQKAGEKSSEVEALLLLLGKTLYPRCSHRWMLVGACMNRHPCPRRFGAQRADRSMRIISASSILGWVGILLHR